MILSRTLILSSLLSTPLVAAVGGPSFAGLGDLPDGDFDSMATGVSADGTTVCGVGSSVVIIPQPAPQEDRIEASSEAFRWRESTGMVSLGFLSSPTSNPFAPPESDGSCLSGNGDICAGSAAFRASSINIPRRHATSWDASGMIQDLGFLAGASGSFKNSGCLGISDDGTKIVGNSASGDGTQAFIWTETSGAMTGLGFPQTPPDQTGDSLDRTSFALAISGDGSTVVGVGVFSVLQITTITPPPISVPIYNSDGILIGFRTVYPDPYDEITVLEQGSEAFSWTESGGINRLGDLSGGGWGSEATGVSDDGSVIVGFGTPSQGVNEGLIWTNGSMASIGDLPGGDTACNLKDVSGDGSIAIGFGADETGKTAVIWDATNGLRKLSDVLTQHSIELTGWTLTEAVGISSDGDVIVGNGINPSGDPEAWRLTGALALLSEPSPPLPSVALALGWALQFTTEPDNNYLVEYSFNLDDWFPLGAAHSTTGAAGSSTHAVVDPNPAATKFYRVRMLAGSVSDPPGDLMLSQGAVMSFETVPGYVYQAEFSEDLDGWTDLGPPLSTVGNAGTMSHGVMHAIRVYPDPVPSSCSYRVNVTSPAP
ncbi:MAG: hypothetical protein AAGI48_00050 [Verrucomicrobiota bacterium]